MIVFYGINVRFLWVDITYLNFLYSPPGKPEHPYYQQTLGWNPAEPGDVVLFSSLMLHKTNPNVTSNPRWTYVIEYMSLDHFDPGIEPPYFVVSRNGMSCPEFVHFYRGRLNPMNHIKYLGFRWKSNLLNLASKISRIKLKL